MEEGGHRKRSTERRCMSDRYTLEARICIDRVRETRRRELGPFREGREAGVPPYRTCMTVEMPFNRTGV